MAVVIIRMVSTKGVISGTWIAVVPFECPPVIDYGSPMILGIIDRIKARKDFHPESHPKKAMLQVDFVEFDVNFTEVIA